MRRIERIQGEFMGVLTYDSVYELVFYKEPGNYYIVFPVMKRFACAVQGFKVLSLFMKRPSVTYMGVL